VVDHAQRGGDVSWPAVAVSLAVPAAVLALLMGIETFARQLGDADEDRMRRHLVGLFEQ